MEEDKQQESINKKHIDLINQILNLPTPCLTCVDLDLKIRISGKGEYYDVIHKTLDITGERTVKKTTEFRGDEGTGYDTLYLMLKELLSELK